MLGVLPTHSDVPIRCSDFRVEETARRWIDRQRKKKLEADAVVKHREAWTRLSASSAKHERDQKIIREEVGTMEPQLY